MPEQWKVRCLSHFTLAVRNLERSIAFYSAVGFTTIHDRRDAIWPPSVAENFGMKVAQGRGVLMAIETGELHTRLDLIQWLEPKLPEVELPEGEQVPQLIALLTENVVAAYHDLRSRGIKFIVLRDDEDHRRLGIKAVSLCRDPDGNLLEFIEYMPGLRNSQPQLLQQRATRERAT
jgi:catechol 2,3-dioxygenase-like lactoylglutathione lyase family enzyme